MKGVCRIVCVLLSLSLLACSQEREESSLIDKEGLKYAQGDDKPYTGFYVQHYVNKQKKITELH